MLGIGLYDFFIIHIFTLAVGHYNHSNITVPGKVTGGILGLLLGILIATSAFDIAILPETTWTTVAITLVVSVLFGSFILGPFMKKIFNSPEMHIWHHAHDMPKGHPNGINFGLSLAIWDYIFGTAYIPYEGRDIKLGFPGVESFPQDFVGQNMHGIKTKE